MTEAEGNEESPREVDERVLIRDAERPHKADELDLEYVISIAASRVTKELVDREERRQKRWALVVTVLAAIGVAAFVATLDGAVERKLTSDATKQNIRSILSETVDDLRQEMELQDMRQRLSYLAFSLDFKDAFSDEERDEALSLIKGMAGEDTVLSRSDFLLSLKKIIDSFVSADQLYHVMEITDSYRDFILGEVALASSLPVLLGRHLMYAIDNNTLNELEDVQDFFSDLQTSGVGAEIVWATKPWAMGIDILRVEDAQEKKESLRRHISELGYRSANERALALLTMFQLQESEWYQLQPTKMTSVVTRVFSMLFSDYDEEIRALILSNEGDEIVQTVYGAMIQSNEQMAGEFLLWVTRDTGGGD